MALPLYSILAAIKADPGLKSQTSVAQIAKGLAAATALNEVLLKEIATSHVNADGRLTALDMQKISDATWDDPAGWQKFITAHGNDNGDVVSGYHYVQNDGGSLQFQGRNFIDTVADAIYHFGFKIQAGRYVNEDGNDNETALDVSGWLNFFLNGENIVYGTGAAESLGSGDYSEYFAAARNETFIAGAGNDEIWADLGNDKVLGGDGNDKSGGGAGADQMFGERGNDTLWGDTGADGIYGGAGNDLLGGGAGNDRLHGDSANDLISGDAGRDMLYGGGGDDTLRGDDGSDKLQGGQGRDELSGGAGNDGLRGGADNDTLGGGDGVDFLQGGAGADELILWETKTSMDVISFAKGDSGKTAGAMDHVEGFESGSDKIDLTGLGKMIFAKLDFVGGDKASCFYDGHNLRIDTDGDAVSDMIIAFAWVDGLKASDFLLA